MCMQWMLIADRLAFSDKRVLHPIMGLRKLPLKAEYEIRLSTFTFLVIVGRGALASHTTNETKVKIAAVVTHQSIL